jgi:hypothetical protein
MSIHIPTVIHISKWLLIGGGLIIAVVGLFLWAICNTDWSK